MNSFIITEFKFPIKFGQIILFPEYGKNAFSQASKKSVRPKTIYNLIT